MERWNKEYEDDIKETLGGTDGFDDMHLEYREREKLHKHERKIYTLNDIMEELNLEEIADTVSDKEKKDLADNKDNSSWYAKKLNKMFEALFDCRYKDVLEKDGKSYKIGENGRIFVRFLLKSCSSKDGKKLGLKKYKDVSIQYESYLLYYASEFLKELVERDGTKKERGGELSKTLMQKFGIGSGSGQLMKAVIDFNYTIEEILKDDELEFERKDAIHKEAAEKITNLAEYIVYELPVIYW